MAELSYSEMLLLSLPLFEISFWIYLTSTIFYLIFLGSRVLKIGKVASLCAYLGLISNTFALAFRWIASGHAPLSNLYESLVFFTWGIVLIYLWAIASQANSEYRYKLHVLGAFIMPIALSAMGIASLQPNQEIQPLIPALQSNWLFFHVATASLAYGAFVLSFALSLLFLIKDGVKLSVFGFSCTIINLAFFSIAGKGSILIGKYGLKPDLQDLAAASIQNERIILPYVGVFLGIAFLFYLLSALTLILSKWVKAVAPQALSEKNLSPTLWFHYLITIGSFWHFLALLFLVKTTWLSNEISLKSHPYEVAGFFITFGLTILYLIVKSKYSYLINWLPDSKKLDALSYSSVRVGFPLMTLVIITGSIWANKAWGSYWSWDPKETWSLITWLVWAGYLHARITRGWHGRRTAYFAIIGFASVLFTYLGVNLLLAGLHSY